MYFCFCWDIPLHNSIYGQCFKTKIVEFYIIAIIGLQKQQNFVSCILRQVCNCWSFSSSFYESCLWLLILLLLFSFSTICPLTTIFSITVLLQSFTPSPPPRIQHLVNNILTIKNRSRAFHNLITVLLEIVT